MFGYYIEVSKGQIDLVPDTYIRKQTLVNCERYITQELKELENTILTASERATAMEYELFCALRERIAEAAPRVQATAQAIAGLDVLQSLANVACRNNYCRPAVDSGMEISIEAGRHPVVERMLQNTLFVPEGAGAKRLREQGYFSRRTPSVSLFARATSLGEGGRARRSSDGAQSSNIAPSRAKPAGKGRMKFQKPTPRRAYSLTRSYLAFALRGSSNQTSWATPPAV